MLHSLPQPLALARLGALDISSNCDIAFLSLALADPKTVALVDDLAASRVTVLTGSIAGVGFLRGDVAEAGLIAKSVPRILANQRSEWCCLSASSVGLKRCRNVSPHRSLVLTASRTVLIASGLKRCGIKCPRLPMRAWQNHCTIHLSRKSMPIWNPVLTFSGVTFQRQGLWFAREKGACPWHGVPWLEIGLNWVSSPPHRTGDWGLQNTPERG